MRIGIIITGIVCDYFLDDLIKCYKDCNFMLIITTWNYINKNIIDKLKENNFLVVQSDFPENIHPNTVNFQNYSGKVGIEYAESLGITHILRVRADMECNNINKLLEIYKNIYQEGKNIFLLHFHNNPIAYLIDYGHFGNIDDTKKYICNFQNCDDSRFPEQFRQEMCYGTNDINIINNYVIYSGHHLLDANIDFSFLKDIYKHYRNLIKTYVDFNNSVGFSSF
jgi:hypothetical protein